MAAVTLKNVDSPGEVYAWYLAQLQEEFHPVVVKSSDIDRLRFCGDSNAQKLEAIAPFQQKSDIEPPVFSISAPGPRGVSVQVFELTSGERRFLIFPLRQVGVFHAFAESPPFQTLLSMIGDPPPAECKATSIFTTAASGVQLYRYDRANPDGDDSWSSSE